MEKQIAILQGDGDSGRRLRNAIEKIASDGQTVFFKTFKNLTSYLKLPGNRPAIIVLAAENIRKLDDMVASRDLLNDFRIILVLPDRTERAATVGFRIYPRYVGYIDGDFSDVSAVLQKMLETDRSKSLGSERRRGNCGKPATRGARRNVRSPGKKSRRLPPAPGGRIVLGHG